jgi:hypothetical protein
MSFRTAMLCVALGVGSVSAPMISSAGINLDIDIAPPAPREEVVPQLQAGYVWAPGYWNYSGNKHVWVAGHQIRERKGHHWVADHWEQNGSHWHMQPGHWD